ncbi:MAG: hypothetical protein NTV51_08025 [Verrucomicrobia bacterium]|nr:hypothetical protein [Verrucomicrobiota bacterium]
MPPTQPPTFSSPTVRRRRVQVAVLTLALAFAGVATGQPLKRYDSLTLKDGRQLSSVEIVTYTTTDVLVRHAGGATSLRTEVLPDQLIVDLHLPAPVTAQSIATNPALMALAEKVAVADPVAAPAHAQPAGTPSTTPAAPPVADPGSNVSAEQLLAAQSNASPTPAAPAGEGNLTEFVAGPSTIPTAPTSHWTTLPGRVAVTLPSGETHLLADVEVRAYPAELLARYLVEAQAASAGVAQRLRTEAAEAAQAGRLDESSALTERAARTAANYLNLLPTAPYSTRSDAYGHFTLRHDLRDLRLVAVGRINVAKGEWTYAWVAVAPGQESLLTEANATAISSPEGPSVRLAVQ